MRIKGLKAEIEQLAWDVAQRAAYIELDNTKTIAEDVSWCINDQNGSFVLRGKPDQNGSYAILENILLEDWQVEAVQNRAVELVPSVLSGNG